jgi:hypothetical protein
MSFRRRTLPPRVKSIPQRGTGRGVMGPAELGAPQPKREYVRSETLREAYRLIPCQFPLITLDSICGKEDGTVACCHSNQLLNGKGMAIKADDSQAAAGCSTCHFELDQGRTLTWADRVQRFAIARRRSVALLVERGLWPAGVPLPDAIDSENP